MRREAIARSGPFPGLSDLWADAQGALQRRLAGATSQAGGVWQTLNLQVYGSFGWQHLTGLPYVRPGSDLDLIAPVSDDAGALHAALALERMAWPVRLDGELAFPDGHSIAWREYLMRHRSEVAHVLVKHRSGVALV